MSKKTEKPKSQPAAERGLSLNVLKEMALNITISRTEALRKLLDPRRDIFAECGHPETIGNADYTSFFERGDVARRVVSLFPEESWSESPAVVENETENDTPFETEWKVLEDKFRVWSYLQRADILSGVGRFGVLLLGFDDGGDLQKPVSGTENKLLFIRPFEENLVNISKLENNQEDPRFGLPTIYSIQFVDVATQTGQEQTARQISVHWTRIIHIADNRTNSDVYGTPRMKWVFNRLLDLRKVAGGSGEMFWKGGFPGLALEPLNKEDGITVDTSSIATELDRYMNGLQRYIALDGMSAKSLAPQVADPEHHIEAQLKLIATAMGVPWRIFIGSEQGQLASGQDSVSWNKRINRRRQEYVTPFIIRPFIERLMEFGALPVSEDYEVKWPDLNTPSDEEKATVAKLKTEALSKYVQSGVEILVPPFQYLTMVLGMTDEEANGIIDETHERFEEMQDLELEAQRTGVEGQKAALDAPQAPDDQDRGVANRLHRHGKLIKKGNPFEVRKRGNKFVVIQTIDGKVMGTHDTRKEALAQFKALEINFKD